MLRGEKKKTLLSDIYIKKKVTVVRTCLLWTFAAKASICVLYCYFDLRSL